MDTETTALQATFDAIVPTLANRADVQAFEARFDTIVPTLATKADLRALEGRFDTIIPTLATKADLKGLEGRFDTLEARFDIILPTLATKSDILSLESKMHDAFANFYKWMIATMVGMFIGFGGLFLAASNMLKLPAQAALTPYTSAAPAPLPPSSQR